jgi:hypothetical protein
VGGTAAAATGQPASTAISGAPSGLTGAGAGSASTAASGPSSWLAGAEKTLTSPSTLLSAAGLIPALLEGDKKPAFSGQLESQASQLQAQGAQLEGYLTSGTLPPGISAGLQSAHDSAAATIRAQYAQRGMTGSSAEAQDLANLANTTVSQGAQIAQNLLSQGVSESEFASQIYSQLMQASISQDENLSKSIAGFAGSLASGAAKAA